MSDGAVRLAEFISEIAHQESSGSPVMAGTVRSVGASLAVSLPGYSANVEALPCIGLPRIRIGDLGIVIRASGVHFVIALADGEGDPPKAKK